MNTLVKKELRDSIRWIPIGWALITAMMIYILRLQNFYYQLSHTLYVATWFCSAIFGLFLSIVSFLPDERESARAFLVHRGVELERIYGLRVLVGLSVYLLTFLLPLACVAIYLASIGPVFAPVSPRQVIPACIATLFCSGFYFAGIIVCCRPSRWFGTRLLPVALAIASAFMAIGVLEAMDWTIMAIPLTLGCIGLLILALAARHAFLRLPSSTPPTAKSTLSHSLLLTLLFSSCLVVSAICTLPINTVSYSRLANSTIMFDADGLPWLTTTRFNSRQLAENVLPPIPMTETPAGGNEQESSANKLSRPEGYFSSTTSDHERWNMRELFSPGLFRAFFSQDGYLYFYENDAAQRMNLRFVVSTDRVSEANEPHGVPFRHAPHFCLPNQIFWPQTPPIDFSLPAGQTYRNLSEQYLVDEDGVLFLDIEKRTVKREITKNVTNVSVQPQVADRAKISIASHGEVSVYNITFKAAAGNNASQEQQEQADAQSDRKTRIQLESTFTVANERSLVFAPFVKDSNNWTVVAPLESRRGSERKYLVERAVDGKQSSYEFRVPREVLDATQFANAEVPIVMAAVPFASLSIPIIVTRWYGDDSIENKHLAILAIQMLISGSLALIAAKARGLTRAPCVRWALTGLIFGVGTWLAVLAIYPRVVSVPCPNCKQRRRVERERCEHCNADWEVAKREGIEIFESESNAEVTTQVA